MAGMENQEILMAFRLLDLFCGAGGAAMGYHRAGFEVVGVDINSQPHYPFDFHQADALTYPLDGFDAIHASPPCQAYSVSTIEFRSKGKKYPDLLATTRFKLRESLYVIENVSPAPLQDSFVLCGTMFGLKTLRHRRFECNWDLGTLISICSHKGSVKNGDYIQAVGHGQLTPTHAIKFKHAKTIKEAWSFGLGIDWMTVSELSQAIPPAYTEFIGDQLIKLLSQSSQDERSGRGKG